MTVAAIVIAATPVAALADAAGTPAVRRIADTAWAGGATPIVVVAHDHEVQDIVDVITRIARTDRIGDGKIFITPVEQVIRVRTGETGAEAL